MGRFVFKKLLATLEGLLRYRFNNPERLVKAAGIKPGQTVLNASGKIFNHVRISKMAGLGAILTSSADMGSTVIRRGHSVFSADGYAGIA